MTTSPYYNARQLDYLREGKRLHREHEALIAHPAGRLALLWMSLTALFTKSATTSRLPYNIRELHNNRLAQAHVHGYRPPIAL